MYNFYSLIHSLCLLVMTFLTTRALSLSLSLSHTHTHTHARTHAHTCFFILKHFTTELPTVSKPDWDLLYSEL